MKQLIAGLLAACMLLTLAACGMGGGSAEPTPAPESIFTEEELVIVEAVRTQMQSGELAELREFYNSMVSSSHGCPAEATDILHYENEDLDGAPMDCYLVNIAAEVAWWDKIDVNTLVIAPQIQVLISRDGTKIVDSVSADAAHFDGDTSTEEGRIRCLLAAFGRMMNGEEAESFFDEKETVTAWTAEKIAVVNNRLAAAAPESKLSAQQLGIVAAVRTHLQSEELAARQALYRELTGTSPRSEVRVTDVIHYEVRDFEGVPVDCYLVNIAAHVAWLDQEDGTPHLDSQYQLYLSSDGKTVVDSISIDVIRFDDDVSTEEGRIRYLLWAFGAMVDGNTNFILNDMETRSVWNAEWLAYMNEHIR
ncbi:MAG: hypothetical protein IJP64_05970 [Oscillospiraceae bacterium]|nr:hypothetical protein [Oscillospiraceae bacterium]